jgi:hypothetical protein
VKIGKKDLNGKPIATKQRPRPHESGADPNKDPEFVPLAERLKWYDREITIEAAKGKVVDLMPAPAKSFVPALSVSELFSSSHIASP